MAPQKLPDLSRVEMAVLATLATPLRGGVEAGVEERNAGKYGSMFSWWYDALPAATLEAEAMK